VSAKSVTALDFFSEGRRQWSRDGQLWRGGRRGRGGRGEGDEDDIDGPMKSIRWNDEIRDG
jgi:hypothetical protein